MMQIKSSFEKKWSLVLIFSLVSLQAMDNSCKPQAFIITGPTHSGKSSLAKEIVKYLDHFERDVIQMSINDHFKSEPVPHAEPQEIAQKFDLDLEKYDTDDEYSSNKENRKKYYDFFSYLILNPFHESVQKTLKKNKQSILVIDYVADAQRTRDEFASMILENSHPILISLSCKLEVAQKRATHDCFIATLKKHYTNPKLTTFASWDNNYFYDTSQLSLQDYSKIARDIIDHSLQKDDNQ